MEFAGMGILEAPKMAAAAAGLDEAIANCDNREGGYPDQGVWAPPWVGFGVGLLPVLPG